MRSLSSDQQKKRLLKGGLHQWLAFNANQVSEQMVMQDRVHDRNKRQTTSTSKAKRLRTIVWNQQCVEFAKQKQQNADTDSQKICFFYHDSDGINNIKYCISE